MSVPTWLKEEIELEQIQSLRYWVRTPMGIETIVEEEINNKIEVLNSFKSHRNLFIDLPLQQHTTLESLLCQVKTADDIFRFIACYQGIGRAKDTVNGLVEFFKNKVLSFLKEKISKGPLRVTVSFVGKRNFSRFFLENKFNVLICEQLDLKTLSNELKEEKQEGEIRLRCHIENDFAFFGLGLKESPLHRRSWRTLKYLGQLRPTVAAAMTQLLGSRQPLNIVDPFCGSATILMETALKYPDHMYLGMDISIEAVTIAKKSAQQAKVNIEIIHTDSLDNLPDLKDFVLLSNPPWDEKHPLIDHRAFSSNLISLIKKSTLAILLLPDDLIELIHQMGDLRITKVATTRIRGKLASIIKIDHN